MTIKISKKPVAPKHRNCYVIETYYIALDKESEHICRTEKRVRDVFKLYDGMERVRNALFYYDKNGAKFKATLS